VRAERRPEHRAILAAIQLRDAERATQLTADHIRVPAQRLQAELEDDDNPETNDSELSSA
jgi:DNA-binding GntR family transcriptional regulator